jgi:hypothetical protein
MDSVGKLRFNGDAYCDWRPGSGKGPRNLLGSQETRKTGREQIFWDDGFAMDAALCCDQYEE